MASMMASFMRGGIKPVRKKVSAQTIEAAERAKEYLEKKYAHLSRSTKQRDARRQELEERMHAMGLSEDEKDQMREKLFQAEHEMLAAEHKRYSVHDFESIAVIGKGAFGEVRVVRQKNAQGSAIGGELLAMKAMVKDAMVRKNQVSREF